MDITTINQILFPVVLFIIIFSSFYIETEPFNSKNASSDSITFDSYSNAELEQFFETVSQDYVLIDKLEVIFKEENFIEQIIIFGDALGHNFTASDVRQSIAEHTANVDGSYICLPHGCWQIA